MLDADEDDQNLIEINQDLVENFNPVIVVDVDMQISAHLNIKKYFAEGYVKQS